jgi:hypothetical protein
MESITWNGNNIDEIEAFAIKHKFGYSVGSPIRCEADHSITDDNHVCAEDNSVLEVYGQEWIDPTIDKPATWTHADVGDIIYEDGSVKHFGPPVRFNVDAG